MTETTTPAVDKAQAEVAAHPDSVDGYCNLGWGYYGARQYAEAIAAFREGLRLDAGSVDALYGLGLSLKEDGQQEEAISVFDKVVTLAPQRAKGARGRMLSRLSRGHINLIRKGDWDIDMEIRRDSDETDTPLF